MKGRLSLSRIFCNLYNAPLDGLNPTVKTVAPGAMFSATLFTMYFDLVNFSGSFSMNAMMTVVTLSVPKSEPTTATVL